MIYYVKFVYNGETQETEVTSEALEALLSIIFKMKGFLISIK